MKSVLGVLVIKLAKYSHNLNNILEFVLFYNFVTVMGNPNSEIDAITPHPREKIQETAIYLQDGLALSDTSLEAHVKEIRNPKVLSCIDKLELRMAEDGYLKWKPDASGHPRNWSASRKVFDTSLVLLLDLFT